MKVKVLLGTVGFAALALGGYQLANTDSDVQPTYKPRSVHAPKQSWNDAAEHWKQLRQDPTTGEIPWDEVARVREQVEAKAKSGSRARNLSWAPVGPDNQGGRTRALAIDPTNSNRVYMGSVSGGLFVSDNAGGQWRVHDQWDGIDSYSPFIATIAIAANGDIYVGTGCSFDDPWPGEGIYKSTDGGATFQVLDSTVPTVDNNPNTNWAKVNRIACDPNNSSRVYACINNGFRVSDDGGATWFNPMYLDDNCTLPMNSGTADDVEVTPDGRVFLAMQGKMYISENGNDCSFTQVTDGNVPSSAPRIDIAIAPSDADYVYAIYLASDAHLQGLYGSTDGGDTWEELATPVPGSAEDPGPLEAMFGEPSRPFGQGVYDLGIAVSPTDPGTCFMGGVELWRYDGNVTRIAGEFFSQFSENYVHSDKHFIAFDPNSPNVMYVCSDGGLSKSQDGGVTFYTANRGYQTTQSYAIAVSAAGYVLAGNQDNGTLLLGYDLQGNGTVDGFEVNSGDGMDCEISTIVPATFSSSQEGYIGRQQGSGDYSLICGQYCPEPPAAPLAPFRTVFRLWENISDPTSKDSVVFENDTVVIGLAVASGTTKNFSGTLVPSQADGSFTPGSISIEAGSQELSVDADGTVRNSAGNDVGTVNHVTGAYNFDFDVAPESNLPVYCQYTLDFDAGDVLHLYSRIGSNSIPINYTLPFSLHPGDAVTVQDPVQSLLAMVHGGTTANEPGGISVTRMAIDFNTPSDEIRWIEVSGVENASCMEWSDDGNHLYFGTFGGRVYRISGFNDVYDIGDEDVLVQQQIFSGGQQTITGLSLSPNDQDQLLVTLGNYGATNHVYLVPDATTASGSSAISLQGDLPAMPVYDPEVLLDVDGESHRAVIGTEFGVWMTEDFTESPVVWSNESANLTFTPIYDIRQVKQGYQYGPYYHNIYLGTYGRGVWRNDELTATEEYSPSFGPKFETDVKLYPNPAKTQAMLEFAVQSAENVSVNVYDISGRLMQNVVPTSNFTPGVNRVQLSTSEMPQGTYFATIHHDGVKEVAKFVVLK